MPILDLALKQVSLKKALSLRQYKKSKAAATKAASKRLEGLQD